LARPPAIPVHRALASGFAGASAFGGGGFFGIELEASGDGLKSVPNVSETTPTRERPAQQCLVMGFSLKVTKWYRAVGRPSR